MDMSTTDHVSDGAVVYSLPELLFQVEVGGRASSDDDPLADARGQAVLLSVGGLRF